MLPLIIAPAEYKRIFHPDAHTGNISRAWVNGEDISNCEARRILGAGAYIDLVSGEVIDDRRGTFEDNFGNKIDALIARDFN